jgi:hypothetical protein
VIKQKLCPEFLGMKSIIKLIVEHGVNDVERRLWVLLLAKDYSSIDVMQEVVKLVRLVGESTVVVKDIPRFTTAFRLWGDAYWRGRIRRTQCEAVNGNPWPGNVK